MNLFDEFISIAELLTDNDIPYALVGGVAMAFHSEPRFTKDIDLIIYPEHIDELQDLLQHKGYSESTPPWEFNNAKMTLYRFIKIQDEDHMQLDILTAGDERTREIVVNALTAESDNGNIKVALKQDLVWMKNIRKSKQDIVDISNLEEADNA